MQEEWQISGDPRGSAAPSVEEEAPVSPPVAEEYEKRIREYQEQIRRAQADFENYRRRTDERLGTFAEEAAGELITALLPVLDNLERALAAVAEHDDVNALREGVTMIHRQFVEVLERAGIARIPANGEAFDPGRYEAVAYEESADVPPLHVVEELRAGYTLKSKVLRPALVKVAKEPEPKY